MIKKLLILTLLLQSPSKCQMIKYSLCDTIITWNIIPHIKINYIFSSVFDSLPPMTPSSMTMIYPTFVMTDTISYNYSFRIVPYTTRFDKSLYYKISIPIIRTDCYFLKSFVHFILKWIAGIFISLVIFIIIKMHGELGGER